jgi:hypothetical protein
MTIRIRGRFLPEHTTAVVHDEATARAKRQRGGTKINKH